jgi:hypothetical protein
MSPPARPQAEGRGSRMERLCQWPLDPLPSPLARLAGDDGLSYAACLSLAFSVAKA